MAALRFSLVSLLTVFSIGYICCGEPTVDSPAGTFIGLEKEVDFYGRKYKVHEYLGVPFAEPPVGELRLEKPRARAAFTAPYRAVEYGAACLQFENSVIPAPDSTAEDCLFLNIFVPAGETASKPESGFPVMVFIHGGAFTIGDTETYHSDTLSGFGNVIVVTASYRLAILGFLSTGDNHIPGNYGLWDQQMALQWVHTNIRAFGGDADRVTIFGESAGGVSVTYQALYAGNRGLFQGVIAQSGTMTVPGLLMENPLDSARAVAELIGCENAELLDSAAIRKCVLSLSEEELASHCKNAYNNMTVAMSMRLWPVFDNDFVKLSQKQVTKLGVTEISAEEEFFSSVHFMNGANNAEGALFMLPMLGVEDPENFVVPRDLMESTLIPGILASRYPKGFPAQLVQFVLSEYTDWTKPEDPVLLRDQYVKLLGDNTFVLPAIEMTKKHANLSGPGHSFLYQFSYRASMAFLPTPSWVQGANHGDDIAFVFGFDRYTMDKLEATFNSSYQVKDQDIQLSKSVMTLWTNFAKSWDPNTPEAVQPSLDRAWPAYDLENQQYLEINEESKVKRKLDAKGDNFWFNLVPLLLDGFKQDSGAAGKYGENQQDSCTADGSCPP